MVRGKDSTIYIGGLFHAINGQTMNNIAMYRHGVWSNLGTGMDGWVKALFIDTVGNLFAGGFFSIAGGVSANRIAKWNGSNWAPLGSGLQGIPRTITADHVGAIYVGGETFLDGANYTSIVTKWNGTQWQSVGERFNGVVFTLLADSLNHLYAGGSFSKSGTIAVPYFGYWDGSSWSAVGGGMDYSVYTLLQVQDTLYVGGEFHHAGTLPTEHLALWAHGLWSKDNISPSKTVYSIVRDSVHGGIFAACDGGLFRRHPFSWLGTMWSFDSQASTGFTNAVITEDDSIWVSGSAFLAGNILSPFLAKAKFMFDQKLICFGTDSINIMYRQAPPSYSCYTSLGIDTIFGQSSDSSVAVFKGGFVYAQGPGSTQISIGNSGDYGYYPISKTITVKVNPCTLSVANIYLQDKTYDGTDTAIIIGAYLSGTFASGDERSDSISLVIGNANYAQKDVGTKIPVTYADVALAGTLSFKYVLLPLSRVDSASITAKSLYIYARDTSKIAGESNPEFHYTTSGFIAGEDESLIQGIYPITTATTASPAGLYTINWNGASAPNYNIIYQNTGYLTIQPAANVQIREQNVAQRRNEIHTVNWFNLLGRQVH